MKPKIFLGTDHAGFELKESVKAFLMSKGYDIEDCGALKFDEKDDYPAIIHKAASSVAKTKNSLGIVFGGSGQGEAIVANKVKGIRAALYYGGNKDILKLSKTHNNANILSLGARFLKKDEAIKAVAIWLNSTFVDEPRHNRRIDQINDLEK